MKLPLVLAILLCGSSLHAADQFDELKTLTGKTYLKVTVTKVELDGLRIVHESGTAKLAFEDLPKDLQTRYNYDPAKAAEAKAKEAAKRAEEDAYLAGLDRQMAPKAPTPAPQVQPPAPLAPQAPSAPVIPPSAPAVSASTGRLVDVKLQAKTSSAGREEVENLTRTYGSFDQNIFRARVVSATVQSNQSGDGDVEVYWIGSVIGKSGSASILKTDKQRFTLTPGVPISLSFTHIFVESEEKSVRVDNNYDGTATITRTRFSTGDKYVGWVVRVLNADGRVLAVQGSRPPLIEMIKSKP